MALLNESFELTESTRFKNDSTPHINMFLSGATKGKVESFLNLVFSVSSKYSFKECHISRTILKKHVVSGIIH